ncbi:MAG: CaiB/BaiF CoA transferase family protein [Acidimicrobiia bacterium]
MADDLFTGVRVLELAEWTFMPAAAAVMAEFGADVIKVERPEGGDIQRGLAVAGVSPIYNGVALQMEQTNRGGKRSIGLDITTPEGRDLVYRLVEQSDVFMTSLLPKTRKRLGYEPEDITAVNPKIIYAVGSGLGPKGPESDKGGYDMTAYWCRSGIAYSVTDAAADDVVQMRPGIGDRFGAMNMVAGISAALFRRERTGKGAVVDVSLLATGMWQLASDIVYSTALQAENSRVSRGRNPLVGYYRTSDDRWLTLTLLESDKWWPQIIPLIGLGDLLDDPRYAHSSVRAENFEQCREEISRAIGSRTLAQWREALRDFAGPWEPVQSVLELASDPQVVANGYLQSMTTDNGQSVQLVPAPIQFDGGPGRFKPCPEAGAQTEEVLLELGFTWDEIIAAKELGTII